MDLFMRFLAIKKEINEDIQSIDTSPEFSINLVLKRQYGNDKTKSIEVYSQIQARLDKYREEILTKLENLIRFVDAAKQKMDKTSQETGRKIAKMDAECQQLAADLTKWVRMKQENLTSERDKLNLFSSTTKRNQDRHNVGIDILMDEKDTIGRSNAKAQDMIDVGHNIMSSLHHQGSMLNRVKKRVGSIMNELGLSQMLTGMISKRARNDCWLLAVLFILLLVLIYLMYFFVRPLVKGAPSSGLLGTSSN